MHFSIPEANEECWTRHAAKLVGITVAEPVTAAPVLATEVCAATSGVRAVGSTDAPLGAATPSAVTATRAASRIFISPPASLCATGDHAGRRVDHRHAFDGFVLCPSLTARSRRAMTRLGHSRASRRMGRVATGDRSEGWRRERRTLECMWKQSVLRRWFASAAIGLLVLSGFALTASHSEARSNATRGGLQRRSRGWPSSRSSRPAQWRATPARSSDPRGRTST